VLTIGKEQLEDSGERESRCKNTDMRKIKPVQSEQSICLVGRKPLCLGEMLSSRTKQSLDYVSELIH
jgi:hypothetical protein